MYRNEAMDPIVFDLERDAENIIKLYRHHRSEVREYLNVQNESGRLHGMFNKEVYELIEEELGFGVPV